MIKALKIPAYLLDGVIVPQTGSSFTTHRRRTPDKILKLDFFLLHKPTGKILSQHHTRRAAVILAQYLVSSLGIAYWKDRKFLESGERAVVAHYVQQECRIERAKYPQIWKPSSEEKETS